MSSAFQRFHAGDIDALGEAVAEHAPAAYTLAFGILQDEEVAESVVADCLADQLEAGSTMVGDDGSADRAAFMEAVRNEALARRRAGARARWRSRRHVGADQTQDAFLAMSAGATIEGACFAFEQLQDAHRVTLGLAFAGAASIDDISERLGISPERARAVLRDALLAVRDAAIAGLDA
jgi:DNA-directed RNA polymerase specialized sigma24 family protein